MGAARRTGYLALAVALATLAGCASDEPLRAWRAKDLAALDAVPLSAPRAAEALPQPRQARALAEVAAAVAESVGVLQPEILVVEGSAPNAFAYTDDSVPVIAVSVGMLRLLGEDRDACAALIGHELAHFYLRHQAQRRARELERDGEGGALGMLLALAGLPLAPVIADLATIALERGHTRDEEFEADRIGMEYMARAGFDPQGALRLQEKLAASGAAALPFFATHPSGESRVAAMRALLGQPASGADSAAR